MEIPYFIGEKKAGSGDPRFYFQFWLQFFINMGNLLSKSYFSSKTVVEMMFLDRLSDLWV